ncbi:class I SAM-dependent methyltransferase [Hoyosella sp. G463]|uniref:Class I SAM-dependent methyltransferase n=1 Tax=Lolliginicoccus lacisalsi TaxID=2742202 RepID=A0A927PLK6_9ACTN|nr:class I SAM-dependent methyltransferase [Lolliginicoccus lacisalsi]MBD8505491.1 class I SAM-dependent methyltransferase [Lolliginicoccus lacisalsi]
MLRGGRRRGTVTIPSPNIWHWPEIYEIENAAQDHAGALAAELQRHAGWSGAHIVDIGCGTGYHLPLFAEQARAVTGIEPHPPLVGAARERTADLGNVIVLQGRADAIPLPGSSVDIVHARTAYFFGPGCEPGIREALRVLVPGGCLLVVDLDATAGHYGEWMRADLPRYDPVAVEAFFERQGFELARIDTEWVFGSRADLEAVLGIEFSPRVASRARQQVVGTCLPVRYRVHCLRKPRIGSGGA